MVLACAREGLGVRQSVAIILPPCEESSSREYSRFFRLRRNKSVVMTESNCI